MHVADTVRRFIEQYTSSQNTLIVGVSGGLDSMTLLHVVHALSAQRPPLFRSLFALHVHHGLRQAADRDEALVERYCRALGIAHQSVRVQVDANSGEGLEAAARTARYEALLAEARRHPNPVVLLAHHQDDQVETVLLRWLRGAGLHGLAGMRAVTTREEIPLLRPLLALSKAELAEYAAVNQVPHVEDESNQDDRFSRNYLRHHVVPRLRHLQPEIGALTARLTGLLQDDDDYLTAAAQALKEQAVAARGDGLFQVHCETFNAAHVSLQRRLIHILLNCFASAGWTQRHLEAVRQLAGASETGSSLQLPRGIHVWRSYESLYIGYSSRCSAVAEPSTIHWNPAENHRLTLDVPLARWRFFAVFTRPWDDLPASRKGLWRLCLPAGTALEVSVGLPTAVRVRPLGLNGSKKLQDIYTDKKVPRSFRSQWPIVTVNGEVVWLPGLVRTEVQTVQAADRDMLVVVAHMNPDARQQIGTLSRGTRRMISE